jgi:predicted N-acyltransferase
MNACATSGSTAITLTTRLGRARIFRRDELENHGVLRSAFAGYCKDHRFYEILNATLNETFDYRYLVLEDQTGRVRAIQPFFFVDQDLMMASRARPAAAWVRKFFPRFLMMRMLMVGCPVGEGHLGAETAGDGAWVAEALHEALQVYSRGSGASLVILKDFSPGDRAKLAPFSNNGYTRLASMPMARLSLDTGSFEEYMQQRLSKAMRKNLRRKFRKADQGEALELEVVTDVTPFVDEVYPLYLQVHERSSLKFERLTKEYLCELGRKMPDRARFFIWRLRGRAVALAVCMVHGEAIYDEYLGLDYGVALDLHLYFCTFRDIMRWAIEQKLKFYYSSPLNYDPKLHLRFELYPLDLYVMHTSRWLNPVFRRVLPFVQPTRSDPVLRRFPNAEALN